MIFCSSRLVVKSCTRTAIMQGVLPLYAITMSVKWHVTLEYGSLWEEIRNKKNIENKKKIDAEGKFDARWDDKLKFFFKVPYKKIQKFKRPPSNEHHPLITHTYFARNWVWILNLWKLELKSVPRQMYVFDEVTNKFENHNFSLTNSKGEVE